MFSGGIIFFFFNIIKRVISASIKQYVLQYWMKNEQNIIIFSLRRFYYNIIL